MNPGDLELIIGVLICVLIFSNIGIGISFSVAGYSKTVILIANVINSVFWVIFVIGVVIYLIIFPPSSPKTPSSSSSMPNKLTTISVDVTAIEQCTNALEALVGGDNIIMNEENFPTVDWHKLPVAPFTLDKGKVFRVNWVTPEDEFEAGTSTAICLSESDEPILITACHYFDNSYTDIEVDLSDLSSYIIGGDITDITDGSPLGNVRANIPIVGAADTKDTGDASYDLAAFSIEVSEEVIPFTLAEETCQTGDVVYLLAEPIVENEKTVGVYPCVVLMDDGGTLMYILSNEISTFMVSGAPIVNSAGEIVGLHMASGPSVRAACSASSIRNALETAIQVQS